jgi:hypothetical protein
MLRMMFDRKRTEPRFSILQNHNENLTKLIYEYHAYTYQEGVRCRGDMRRLMNVRRISNEQSRKRWVGGSSGKRT